MLTTKTGSFQSEFQRIKKLNEFDLDYLEIQDEVKNLIELAGIIAGTEISVLNFIDNHAQWSISPKFQQPNSRPREDSVCNYTIKAKDSLEIPRLDLDDRFADKDYVRGDNGLKYYFGVPLTLKSGEKIGALCMVDRAEMSTSESKREALRLIAKEIVEKLELNKKLNELSFSLSETIRIKNQVAHDVRGPINGIAGLAEVGETEDASPEEMREYFRLIKDSGKSVLDLTDEILNSAQKTRFLHSSHIDLLQLQEKFTKLYQLPARSKNIDFQVNVNPEATQYSFPKRKLLSITGNLISNSIKFTPPGGRVKVDLNIVNSEIGKIISITVSDTGQGFSEAAIRDYYNDELESSLGNKGEKGFGLGLRLVHEMVQDLGGKLDLASKENKGTKIEVRLPIN